MTTAPFQSASEEAYAEYLTLAGLAYQYEQRWGTAQPDFTISRPGTLTEPIAIADIKDVRHSDPDEALLAAGEEIRIQRNPALKTRRLIHSVWRQFGACADYPCILVLASGGDTLPDPGSVMAAMLGDLTTWVRVPATPGIRVEVTLGFGEHGKMVDQQGNPRNTRISAIGLLSPICPDDVYSGYAAKVSELAVQHLSDDSSEEAAHRYLAACTDLKVQLMAAGYELGTFATQVEYVVNPLAAQPFPTADLAQGYVKVWEYDLETQRFGMTYDWGKLGKPRQFLPLGND